MSADSGNMKIPGCLICLLLLMAAGCSKQDGGKGRLAVSIPPQKWLLEAIVGDRFDIDVLFAQGTDAETTEPGLKQMADLNRAQAFFTVGTLAPEEALLKRIVSSNPDLKVVDTGAQVVLISGTHGNAPDPHIWTSPANLVRMAREMLQTVCELDPDNDKIYAERFFQLKGKIESFSDRTARRLSYRPGTAFAMWHPALTYFARDYCLKQIGMETDGKEATPKQIADRLTEAAEKSVRVVVAETGGDSAKETSVAKELGVPVVKINPLAEDILGELNKVADAIVE